MSFTEETAQELIDSIRAAGSIRARARQLGIAESGLRRSFRKAIEFLGLVYEPELILKGTSTLVNARGDTLQRWDKTRQRGRHDAEVQHLPDPKTIARVSTLYDQGGEVTQQWVTEKPDEARRREAWEAWAAQLAERMPAYQTAPLTIGAKDFDHHLMACYPIGDHHTGMLAWAKESGANYDLKIAWTLLVEAVKHLVALTPSCKRAAVVGLGDLFHYDSTDPKTPEHGNLLDADGRYQKMADVGLELICTVIEMAACHHEEVLVILEKGNHDPYSMTLLTLALRKIYRDNPRIIIDTSPRRFHCFQHGKCMVATHHGHGRAATMRDLPGIIAADWPQIWGQTEYRYVWTGHVHHDSVKDFPGCKVESFQILPPTDAYAANEGFRSMRSMKAIMLHDEYGEVARHIFNPRMIDIG